MQEYQDFRGYEDHHPGGFNRDRSRPAPASEYDAAYAAAQRHPYAVHPMPYAGLQPTTPLLGHPSRLAHGMAGFSMPRSGGFGRSGGAVYSTPVNSRRHFTAPDSGETAALEYQLCQLKEARKDSLRRQIMRETAALEHSNNNSRRS